MPTRLQWTGFIMWEATLGNNSEIIGVRIDAEMNAEVQWIWPVETGILDLPGDWAPLASPFLRNIEAVWREAKRKLEGTEQLRIFNERLAREWAIETGVIEDVFHVDRGVTLNLIEQGISAALLEHGTVNKPAEYVIDILRDHVEALDWIFEMFVTSKQTLTPGVVKDLHGLMTSHQSHVDAEDAHGRPIQVPLIHGDWKKLPNDAKRDGILYKYCPPEQVAFQIEQLLEMHSRHRLRGVQPEVEAAWLQHRFTQIHPFQDGNGRVARALATLVFLQAGLFPLVITRGEMRTRYIDALELADAGNLAPLVHLFAEVQQFRFDRALNISDELVSPPSNIEIAIRALKAKLEGGQRDLELSQQRIFDRSQELEAAAMTRLQSVAEMLIPVESTVSRGSKPGDHLYRHEVFELAKNFGYFANTRIYLSYVRLLFHGTSTAQLLLSFHGRGSEFAGVLVCLPIFEIFFADEPDTHELKDRIQMQVTDRPFEFYFSESSEELTPRFLRWLEEVLTLTIAQYQRTL